MKNTFWIAAIVLAFGAGYFTRGANQTAQATQVPTETVQHINSHATPQISGKELSAAAKAAFAAKENTAAKLENQTTPQPNTGSAATPHTAPAPQAATSPATDTNNPTAKKYPNEISDEDIDKVLPAPFNQALKNRHGDLREKYKDFAASSQPSDWDKEMQNKLSDAIFGSPYAKFINLESLQCKVNLCEIRLYETKEGVWSLIMAEMRLQDWWSFGGTSASGMPSNAPGTPPGAMGWYNLFPRR